MSLYRMCIVVISAIFLSGVSTIVTAMADGDATAALSSVRDVRDDYNYMFCERLVPPTPIAIAIGDFAVGSATVDHQTAQALETISKQVTNVVRADLATLPLVRLVDPALFPKYDLNIDKPPVFADWTIAGVQALIVGEAVDKPNGWIEISFRLYDVIENRQLMGVKYASTPDNVRQIGHRIVDAIQEKLSGNRYGRFDTRIAFVSKSAGQGDRGTVEHLAIMDSDGAHPRMLTTGSRRVWTPRWSPDGLEIAYRMGPSTDAADKANGTIYIYNLDTGLQEALLHQDSSNLTPSYTPNGEKVIFTQQDAETGNSRVILLDLRTRVVQQLTEANEVATYPEVARDGERFAYVANGTEIRVARLDAKPQACRDGSTSRSCVIARGYPFRSLAWGPKGERIAFTRVVGGRNQIGFVTPGQTIDVVNTETDDSEPSFAPDGCTILFTRNASSPKSELWIMNVDGTNSRHLPTPEGAAQGDWSEPQR